MVLTSIDDWLHAMRIYEGFAVLVAMARRYKNYRKFVKCELRAVPAGIAQPQMGLTSIMKLQKRPFHSPELVRMGTVTSLCADPILRERLDEQLGRPNMDIFKDPFIQNTEYGIYEATWNTNRSGLLGVAIPDVASLGTWLKTHTQCKYTMHGVTSHVVDDKFLSNLFRSGKWKPCISTLKDMYVLNEIILAEKVTIRLDKAVDTGVSASVDPLAGIPSPAESGVSVNLDANNTLEIKGAIEEGVVKPFPIAHRYVHVVFNNDFTLVKKMEFSRDQDPKKLGA